VRPPILLNWLTRRAGEEQKLGKRNNAAVGPEKTLSRQNFKRKVV
jgi:hypothetical protein